MQDKTNRIKELIELLNKASITYYNSGQTIMSDKEFDNLYIELRNLEEETNVILSNSPTQNVGASVVIKELETVIHNHPMLSLDKCHSAEELIKFAGDNDCLLMMKLDGLTISLEYNNGALIKAETRGTGIEGSNIIHNAKVFQNIPQNIPYQDKLIIDGEAIITYHDFERINEPLPQDKKYKNPRNLASGSVIMLDSNEAKKRNLRFIAWKVIEHGEGLETDSNLVKLASLEHFGFDIVPFWTYTNNSIDKENLPEMLSELRLRAEKLGYPIDGAVMLINSIFKGNQLGRTDKFFKHSIAYKYEDESYETILREIKWQGSRTGALTPVAIFDKVKIDGTDVSRASLHNISICEGLQLGIGDAITVYKANMIIPQIAENLTKNNNFEIPEICPICGALTEIKQENDSKVLMCTNEFCNSKKLKKFVHFVSKNAMNIDGLSEATLEKFIELNLLQSFRDIYNLGLHQSTIKSMERFGEKSYNKLITAIEDSKSVKLVNFIYALGIPQIGKTASKTIAEYFKDWNSFEQAIINDFDFTKLKDFGDTTSNNIEKWYYNAHERDMWVGLVDILNFIQDEPKEVNNNLKDLSDLTFVITGSVDTFKNRDNFKELVESLNGKVSGSVSNKTNYLVNNDKTSTTGKNKKAIELGIEIISENDFNNMIGRVI